MSHVPSLFEYAGIAAVTASGLLIALWPRQSKERAVVAHEQKLADRAARGSDVYFEEQRALDTYKPPKSVWTYRLFGLLMTIFGMGYFALQYFRD